MKGARRRPTGGKRVTTREFARLVGVPQPDVVKGMRTGRLKDSLGTDGSGRRFIADRDLALREWQTRATPKKPPATEQAKAPRPRRAGRPETKADADMLVAIERERKLRLENDLREGTLVEAVRVRRSSFETARTVRDSLLNVPDRLASELAAETDAGKVHARLDEEIRAALVALSEALDAEPEPDPVDGGGDAD